MELQQPRIKEKIHQNNQAGKAADQAGWLRKTMARWQTRWAGLSSGETETQSWLWTTAVVVVGETPSLMQESAGKCATDKQVNHTVPSLAPPPQAAPQHSKEGCPTWVNT